MFVPETQVQIILVTQINTKKLPEKKYYLLAGNGMKKG